MASLNFKHLRYFLQVADTGSIARASEQLHISPQTISEQLQQLGDQLGGGLFNRHGRRLALTDKGRMVQGYAREIFTLGTELQASARNKAQAQQRIEFRVGVADAVPKSVAFKLLAPVLRMGEHVHLVCREWRLDRLLAQLALHELDLVIADAPLPRSAGVRAQSHPVGDEPVGFFAAPALLATQVRPFPDCLDGAPMLMPGEDAVMGHQLRAWFDTQGVHPRVVAELDDAALTHEFGRNAEGYFVAPSAMAGELASRLGVQWVGLAGGVREQYHAIAVARRVQHPCVAVLTRAARPAGAQGAGKAVRPGAAKRARPGGPPLNP
ncbi:transcriptional activator NhaR [Aquabacterium parvum]|uniref:transcriptional activator NhaR n=1 Tax=Aquabacterium parvum TaxID=70584 RepID=UPI000A6CB78A|nr:transcriptional activator NhaR [Aquabacterium parvum]